MILSEYLVTLLVLWYLDQQLYLLTNDSSTLGFPQEQAYMFFAR